MAHPIPIGKRVNGLLIFLWIPGALAIPGALHAQAPLTCVTSSAPAAVRVEGSTERIGDILLNCSGGTPGAVVSTSLTLLLHVNVTNKLSSTDVPDATLAIDTGVGGPVAVGAQLTAASALTFPVSFTVPPSAQATLRIANVRAAVSQLPAGAQFLEATLALGSSALTLSNNRLAVAAPVRGLLATFQSSGVDCAASPAPSAISVPNFFSAGTRFFTTRLTEGFAGAFQPRATGDDNGVRFVIRYGEFPAGARLFVPDFVAGSNAAQPTSAGDLGLAQASGQYLPGSGTLLLARVVGADSSGAGGFVTPVPPGPGALQLTSASEVSLSGGAGYAVYEVVDANSGASESAQAPTFLALASLSAPGVVASQEVALAPVSAVTTASRTAPVVRFTASTPPPDCQAVGDCNASYLPRLVVDPQSISINVPAGSAPQLTYVRILNDGGGAMNWKNSVTYKTGSGWLTFYPASGINNVTARVDAAPGNLAPGTYEATFNVDAGPYAGARSIPVILTITAAPAGSGSAPAGGAPAPSPVVVSSVSNAASAVPGVVVPGSLASLKGSRLAGKSVTVTFDGVAAAVLSAAEGKILVQVPPELEGKTSAQLVATVDGASSAAQAVSLAAVAPVIFENGVINQENTVNSETAPAKVGSVVQIFAAGLPQNGSGIFARVHDREIFALEYAGPAPTLTGIQQVNVRVPPDLPAMTTEVQVCGFASGGGAVCSPGAKITLQ
ncbi:MAG: hypothetical protein FJW37_05980 [Acidobacteria bacterium]|nr:hypothetical protein [Acidobacteriota bacterium]